MAMLAAIPPSAPILPRKNSPMASLHPLLYTVLVVKLNIFVSTLSCIDIEVKTKKFKLNTCISQRDPECQVPEVRSRTREGDSSFDNMETFCSQCCP